MAETLEATVELPENNADSASAIARTAMKIRPNFEGIGPDKDVNIEVQIGEDPKRTIWSIQTGGIFSLQEKFRS